MTIFADTDFVVIERGPLVGVVATTTYYPDALAARQYADTRRGFFETLDICKVQTRINTILVPQETIEGLGS
jgi:hypothetical protein